LRAGLQAQADALVAAGVNRADLPRQAAHRAVLHRAVRHALPGKPRPAHRHAAANRRWFRQRARREPEDFALAGRNPRQQLRAM
jgi:phage-related baseplate assembly protein